MQHHQTLSFDCEYIEVELEANNYKQSERVDSDAGWVIQRDLKMRIDTDCTVGESPSLLFEVTYCNSDTETALAIHR